MIGIDDLIIRRYNSSFDHYISASILDKFKNIIPIIKHMVE